MEAALKAIAHPARRELLRLVWDGERSVRELATAVELSEPTTSKHLKVLRGAGLVTVRVDVNRRFYRADPERVAELASFLEDFWGDRLARLERAATARARKGRA